MNAIITNSITDGLLSLLVAYISVAALIQRIQGNERFTRLIVTFFFTMLFLSVCASIAHYTTNQISSRLSTMLWLAISYGTVYLNYCLIYSLRVPEFIRMLVVLIALLFSFFFSFSMSFIFIALSFIFIYILAYAYSEGLAKIGFLAVILSNVIWVIVRKGINYELGYPLPPEFRYDNDVYHLLIMISVFIIYRSIQIGDWRYPK